MWKNYAMERFYWYFWTRIIKMQGWVINVMWFSPGRECRISAPEANTVGPSEHSPVQCCLYEAILFTCFSAAPLWEVTAKRESMWGLSYILNLTFIQFQFFYIASFHIHKCSIWWALYNSLSCAVSVSPLSCVRLSRTPITALIQSSTALPTLLWLLCGRAELNEETSRL